MAKQILKLIPVFKQMVWGGSRMREVFSYDIPGDNTGECWAISAHTNGDCIIADGQFKGKKLSELWYDEPELFGNVGKPSGVFPLLTKLIDARDNLSVQVHPDDNYAKSHENGSLGKTECWYILDCDEDARIIIGHKAKDKAELIDMISNNRWGELIREIPIKKGDFFQINPGTVHAIKGGTLILETQQNSDITYRVYDYGRLQNGKPRELHINKSIDVIQVPFVDNQKVDKGQALTGGSNESLIKSDYYHVWKLSCKDKASYSPECPFLLCSVIEGSGSIDGNTIKKGDHFILPNGYGSFTLEGNLELICSSIR